VSTDPHEFFHLLPLHALLELALFLCAETETGEAISFATSSLARGYSYPSILIEVLGYRYAE
jgi:hypothetical protein